MKRNNLLYLPAILLLMACSMTKNIPEGDQLFTGLEKIVYEDVPAGDRQQTDNFLATQEEVEAALATTPNGALFGSS